jgi:hypothetical protein
MDHTGIPVYVLGFVGVQRFGAVAGKQHYWASAEARFRIAAWCNLHISCS